jgi:phenylacetate-CoA ligase
LSPAHRRFEVSRPTIREAIPADVLGAVEYAAGIEVSRRQAQLAQLNDLIVRVADANEFQRQRLTGGPVASLEQLSAIPMTCKAELLRVQATHPPFGTNLTYPLDRYTHVHLTSGTVGEQLRVPQTDEDWAATRSHFALVLREAGLSSGDRVALPFAFGPYLQFWAAVAGVEAIGALSLPLGGMEARERLRAIAELGATAIICTPSYALALIEAADKAGLKGAFDTVATVICQGEPGASIAAARQQIESALGARVVDHAGSTEVGVFTYPCIAGGGLHVNEGAFICEVLDPHSGALVEAGSHGEMVLTSLQRSGYPMIRFRSGDVVEVGGSCPGGHEHLWLPNGIVGRTDDMVVIGGMNVFPSAIESALREIGVLGGYRIRFGAETSERDEVSVLVETTDPKLVGQIEELVLHRLGLRVRVVPVMPGTLKDARLKTRRIEDVRHRSGAAG